MRPILRRRSYAVTDVGMHRPHNEDAFIADDTLGLYLVADGVGGGPQGEVASAESAEQVRSFVAEGHAAIEAWLAGPTSTAAADGGGDGPDEKSGDSDENLLRALHRLLEGAVQSACYLVHGLAEQDPAGMGMATTLSVLLVAGDHAVVAQVGDSRVYHFRAQPDGGAPRAVQVTDDHTLVNHHLKRGLVTVEEAKTMKGRHLITRAVGKRDWVEVDTFSLRLEPGDRLMVCSDGLHGYLGEGEVDDLLGGKPVERAAADAITLANERGGKDNITAVVVAIR